MIPAEFQPFFTASTAASAALIGLLFVSVSIAPDRVFGSRSESMRQAQALSAFSALANVFFISFGALMPTAPAGVIVTIVSIPAVLQTLSLLSLLSQWRAENALGRGLLLFLASAAVYGYELALGIQLWMSPSNTGVLSNLLNVMLGAYAIGLGRAWELLGAPRSGFLSEVWALLRTARGRKPDDVMKT